MDAPAVFLQVAALNAAYASVIDNDRLEEWPDFFLPQCLYKVTSADNHRRGLAAGIIYADSRAMLSDRVTALRTANIYERQNYRHIIGLPVIAPRQAGDIVAETAFLVVRTMRGGRMDVFAAGVYLDRIQRDADQLFFSERIVVCDSGTFDTLVALPL